MAVLERERETDGWIERAREGERERERARAGEEVVAGAIRCGGCAGGRDEVGVLGEQLGRKLYKGVCS